MKNFLGRFQNIGTKKKALYFSVFMLICFFVAVPVSSVHAFSLDGMWDVFTTNLTSWIRTFIFEVMMIILKFVSLLVYFAAWLVDMFLNPAMYKSILVGTTAADGTTTGAVKLGWDTVRDFCNMFYIFFLLLIAFGTITGSATYNYKSLLPKFIISLFLINFSRTIAMMIIDVGQVFLFGMAAWLGTFSGAQGSGAALTGIVNYFEMALGSLENPSYQDIMIVIFAVIYTFCLAGVYLVLAGFLAVRLIMFACLIIVSPFAFFSMVLPSMRKYTTQWTSSMISNAISGPVLIFFVYISAMMAKNLVDNPVSVDVGDVSKMSGMENILVRLVPHIVAMGILLYGVTAAKGVGAAGQQYVTGGRFGIGKSMGMGYAIGKLGERGIRRSVSGAVRGGRWAKDRSVERFGIAANVQDAAHAKYQKYIGKVPFVGNNMSQADKGAMQVNKDKALEERLKSWGGKVVDIDLALKGDNISKALALKELAAKGKLGDMEDDGNGGQRFKYEKYFGDAQNVLSQKDVKDITSKNIAFAPLTNENRNRKADDGSFDTDAKKRITDAQLLGISPDRAVKDEIMREKTMGLIADGEDGKIQGLENKDVARVLANAYDKPQFTDAIKKMNKDKKKKFSTGLQANSADLETARALPANSANEVAIAGEKMKFATAAVKTGATLEGALALNITPITKHDDHIRTFTAKADTSTIASMKDEDLQKEGHRFDTKQLHSLHGKKEQSALDQIEISVKDPNINVADRQKKIDTFKSFIKI